MKRFEVLKVITYWRRSAQSNEKVGWMLRDHEEQKEVGCTGDEAWDFIREYGAVNAEAKMINTKSRTMKVIEPLLFETPNFYQTSWQMKYEDVPHIDFSSSFLQQVNKFIHIDEKWKIKQKQDDWQRQHKGLISNWKTHEKVLQCIEFASKIQEAKKISVYVGGSVWQEVGLGNIYAGQPGTAPFDELELIFSRPIQEALSKMNIDPKHCEYQFVELPYVFQFLKTVQNLNGNTNIFYEVEPGVFQEEWDGSSSANLTIAIGTNIPMNLGSSHPSYCISHELSHCPTLHGPIIPILKEVARHFVKKGSMLCDVCRQKVAHGVGSSSIAPVTIAVCYSCASKNAEPYWVIVTKAALGKKSNPDYRPGPYFNHVIHSTLDLLGKSKDQYHQDVEIHLEKYKNE
jgi:hypothetical protein